MSNQQPQQPVNPDDEIHNPKIDELRAEMKDTLKGMREAQADGPVWEERLTNASNALKNAENGLKQNKLNIQQYSGVMQYLQAKLNNEILREKAAIAARADAEGGAPTEKPTPKKKTNKAKAQEKIDQLADK